MFGIQDITLFILSGLLLNIMPGPDVLYIASRSAGQGLKAGIMAALGIGTGCVVHITFAAIGLSAILVSSATAFIIVKWIGAGYLIYLGLVMLLEKNKNTDIVISKTEQTSLIKIFSQGVLVNMLNPKVALFFLAFVPQFIDATSPHKLTAFLLLGMVFNCTGTLWNIGMAWLSATAGRKLNPKKALSRWLKKTTGGLFVGLGIRLAISDKT